MIINPIIPVWLMAILCIILLFFKRKGTFNYIRQIIIILLLFIINLRIMTPNGDVPAIAQNVDVLFVVDNTISMQATDYGNENDKRMNAVRNDCAYIMEKFPGASFSVISFGNEVRTMMPYTIDTNNVSMALQMLNGEATLYATGTAFDDALTYLEKALDRKSENFQVVFFISDGEITKEVELGSYPRLKAYIDGGAVLGYGTEEGGEMQAYAFIGDALDQVYTYDENYNRQAALSVIDEENLKSIASDMGVGYVHMTKQSEINKILTHIQLQIDRLGDSPRKDSIAGYSDTYFYLLFLLIPLLAADFIYYKRKKTT